MLIMLLGGICAAEWEDACAYDTVYQLVGSTACERTVVWYSAVREEDVRLVYRADGIAEQSVEGKMQECERDEGNIFRYQAELRGLRCDTVYEYAIVGRKGRSPWYRLSTRCEPYRAVIVTDSQCRGDYQVWIDTMHAMVTRVGDVELWIHLGDLVDCGASAYQWKRWLIGAETVMRACAFAPVLGNHEMYDMTWNMCLPKRYQEMFSILANSQAELDGYAYSFDYGAVRYYVLDTQAQELAEWKSDWIERQAIWLDDSLAQSPTKWKVILCHKPFYDEQGEITEHGRRWLPICRRYGVKLIVSGHHHVYARQETDGITMITAGVSGDDVGYTAKWRADMAVMHPCHMANYLTLAVTDTELTLQAWQVDGQLMDEVVIR